jgi:hypothetical protein
MLERFIRYTVSVGTLHRHMRVPLLAERHSAAPRASLLLPVLRILTWLDHNTKFFDDDDDVCLATNDL